VAVFEKFLRGWRSERYAFAVRKAIVLICVALLFACSKAPAVEREQLEKAAALGDAASQSSLGFMYAEGNGVPKDEAKAADWFQKAAAQGNAFAQAALGVMYAQGRGVPKDYVRAYAWMNLAATKSAAEAAKTRDMLEKQMTTEQIAAAQKLSSELFEEIKKRQQ